MIITFLITMVLGIVAGLFSLVPTWSVDTSTIDTARGVGVQAGSLDGWLPETFLFACIGVIIAVRLFFFAWTAIQWIYRLIPFNG